MEKKTFMDKLFGEKCQRCKETRTSERFCDDCKLLIKSEEESKRTCPIDGVEMEKHISDAIITDKCPHCKGIWLDKEELDILKEGMSSSSDDGFVTGMVVGGMFF